MRHTDDILGKTADTAKSAMAELMADLAETETYRPFLARPSAQVAFLLIEADGVTMHSFQYHTLRHPKIRVRGGEEFITFVSDGVAVVMQGTAMSVMFYALNRQTLLEIREYDGKPMGELATKITRLEVVDPMDEEEPRPKPRLVKER